MNCPTVKLLEQLVDDMLSHEIRDQLVDHIGSCNQCQQMLDSMARATSWKDSLETLNAPIADSSLLDQTLAKVKSSLNLPQDRENTLAVQGISADALAWTQDGFELISVLGQGGMGIVFKARDQSLDRIVAIKVLSPLFAAEQSARERFLREARVAASINHPNVVTIHAVSDTQPLPYLVMEYVDGVSLQDQLDMQGAFDAASVVRIGMQIVAGLAAAHAKGVLHRDVKPANIFLESDSLHVKLGDFGLARVVGQSQLTRDGTFAGTPEFAAPESLDAAAKPDHRADLFSLGSVLYAMCCGRSPFFGDTPLATLNQVANSSPTPLEQRCQSVPRWLTCVIAKLHNKSPDQRYQSAHEVETALQLQIEPAPLPLPTNAVPTQALESKVSLAPNKIALIIVVMLLAAASIYLIPWMPQTNDFAIIAPNGKVLSAHANLVEAVAEAGNGARIEVRREGPFFIEPIQFDQETIALVAAEGIQPVFHFETRHDFDEDIALLTSDGDLYLQGLEFVYLSADEEDYRCLVEASNGEFVADNCRFAMLSEGCCIIVNVEHGVRLTECELLSEGGETIELLTESSGTAHIESCTIYGETAIRIAHPAKCELVLSQCTIATHRAIELLEEESKFPQDPISINSTDCTFEVHDGLIAVNTVELSRDDFSQLLHWSGTQNSFSGPLILVGGDEVFEQPNWCNTFGCWKEVAEESNSTYLDEPIADSVEEDR